MIGTKIVFMFLILIIPFKVSAESYFDKVKDQMSDISNDLIIQTEELSDVDIDSITDGVSSNIDNVLGIVKDLKNLEEPLEKIGYKIKRSFASTQKIYGKEKVSKLWQTCQIFKTTFSIFPWRRNQGR